MFYTILAIIGFFGTLFFLGLRKPTPIISQTQIQEPESPAVKSLTIEEGPSASIDIEPRHVAQAEEEDEETIAATFAIMKDKRMLQLSVLSMLLSMCMAVWTSLFVTFYISTMGNNIEWTQQEKTNQALFTFIPLALGEIVGSFFLGWTYDKLGPK